MRRIWYAGKLSDLDLAAKRNQATTVPIAIPIPITIAIAIG